MKAALKLHRLLLSVLCATAIAAGLGFAQSDEPPPVPRAKFDLQSSKTAGAPRIDYQVHRVGRFWNTVNNNGVIGNIFGFRLRDRHKGAPSFRFPRFAELQHGNYIGLWVGGVVDKDTLVSTTIDELGNLEFWPDEYPFGDFDVKSTSPTSPYYSPWAKAEEEFRIVYTDTFEHQSFVPYNTYDNRKHKPLNIAVMQTSYSWSHSYAENFVIFDYGILNLGNDTIKSAWVGIYYNGTIWHFGELPLPFPDDLEGYIYSEPYEFEELGDELLQIAYIVDRDGRAWFFNWDWMNTPHAFGIAPLHVPTGAYRNNFNWWNHQRGTYYNWGPRMSDSTAYPLRPFFEGLGMPYSDRNKYYLMSKPEIDYSGFEAAVDHTREGWLPPHKYAKRIAEGHAVQLLTSFGPFTLPPLTAETLTVVMAIGENVHSDPEAYQNIYDPYDPQPFMDYLDFDDLISNVRWAKLIYDNPGVDTDGDGDSGKSFWYLDPVTSESLKVFYAGDGVPDFTGSTPPPSPPLRILPEDGRIVIRWNGQATENYIDPMTHTKDFEGYRVYISRSRNDQEAVLLSSYDLEDYNQYQWNRLRQEYELKHVPFTLDSLRALYGKTFEPLEYTYSDPFYHEGEVYYYEKVDYNVSDFRDTREIHRRFPEAEIDTSDIDQDGYMRHYEWEYVIEDLLPTIPYYVSVTAFDFGHMPRSLQPSESSIEGNMTEVFATDQGDKALKDGKLNVYCYPNPYRIDDDYYARGFENRGDWTGPERARSIYFANLPNRCRISIYSLDGDLIRTLEHNEPAGSGTGSVHRWNVISRNTEAVVSGLYYWVVESEYGNQIGKLVIIK